MIKNIVIFILLLIFVAVVVFLDLPRIQNILDLRIKIDSEKEKLSEKQLLLAKIEKLEKKYEEAEESLKKVNYILPSSQEIPNLIVQLEALALEGGLVLESIQFSEVKEVTQARAEAVRTATKETQSVDYKILSIELSLKGTYSAFKNFLKLVEENIRLMDINSISLSPESLEEEMEAPIFDLNIKINTYYQ